MRSAVDINLSKKGTGESVPSSYQRYDKSSIIIQHIISFLAYIGNASSLYPPWLTALT
jgi:hypothetical protein